MASIDRGLKLNKPSDDWTTWFDEHGAALILLARQCTDCRADAEDVVQQAFVQFWRKRKDVRDPLSYLYTCVRRTAMNWHREQQRRRHREQRQQERSGQSSQFHDPKSSAELAEWKSEVESALADLPLEQRQVVVMKIWGGLTFPRIARVLSISPNTAASRYRYGLDALRERISEELIP